MNQPIGPVIFILPLGVNSKLPMVVLVRHIFFSIKSACQTKITNILLACQLPCVPYRFFISSVVQQPSRNGAGFQPSKGSWDTPHILGAHLCDLPQCKLCTSVFCALMAGAIRREMHLVYMYDFSDSNSSSKISRNMPKLFTHHFKFQTEFRIHFFHFLNPELSLKTSFVCFAFPQSSDQKGMDSRNRFPTSKWKYRLTLGRQTFHSQVGFSKGMITLRHYVHCTTLFLEQQVPIRKPALLRYCKKEFSHEYQIK